MARRETGRIPVWLKLFAVSEKQLWIWNIIICGSHVGNQIRFLKTISVAMLETISGLLKCIFGFRELFPVDFRFVENVFLVSGNYFRWFPVRGTSFPVQITISGWRKLFPVCWKCIFVSGNYSVDFRFEGTSFPVSDNYFRLKETISGLLKMYFWFQELFPVEFRFEGTSFPVSDNYFRLKETISGLLKMYFWFQGTISGWVRFEGHHFRFI